MSHEIRTPLNGIIPMLDLLMNSRLPPDQQDFLRTAYTSSRQMLRIVDDILDYSKLEANKLQLETTSFNLRDLLDSIIRLMEKPAEAKGLKLHCNLDGQVRLALRGDPVRLRQVLTNLISNALKFTERGSITLGVTRKGETRTQHELRFEIRDTGIGISKDNIKNLFRAFAQADASTTRLYGGTGLGLVICKRIVDLMGGQIGVDSEPGRGTTFWFEIPLLKAVGDMQGHRTDLNGARILLLSNDPTLRQRMQQAAPGWGAQLADSETTQDALAKLRAGLSRGSTWAYDLLMVDLQSVRSTMIALHRNLQRSAEFEALPVVYLKGHDAPPPELGEGLQVLALSRSMGSAEMRGALTTFIATPPAGKLPPATAVEPFANEFQVERRAIDRSTGTLSGRLLLVEDNPINQKVAQSLIKLLGLQCDSADNGEIAIQKLHANAYDVVLMDCQMPVKDGYTATREWRAHEQKLGLAPIPIIAMTANAMAGDRQKCLDAGMDDYLSKPVDRRLLESCLGTWLMRSPRRGAGEHVGPTGQFAKASGDSAPAARSGTPGDGGWTDEGADDAIADGARHDAAVAELAVWPPTKAAASPAPAMSSAAPVAVRAAPAPAPRPVASSPVAAAAFAAAASAPGSMGDAAAAPGAPVLSMEVLEELKSIMGGEYLGLVQLFLEDAPTHIERLHAAAAANDIAAMVGPAHTLKSSSANLGAMALSAVAKRIEFGARTESLPKPGLAVLMLENEFRRAKAALQQLGG
jgi:CheY-like chemotaxis protein